MPFTVVRSHFSPMLGLRFRLPTPARHPPKLLVMLSQQRVAILAAFQPGETLSPKVIAKRASLGRGSVDHMLPGMLAAGQLQRPALGQYSLPQSDQHPLAAQLRGQTG